MNFGTSTSGEFILCMEDTTGASSTGVGHLEVGGEGLGVLNIPLGMGIPRSMAEGRVTLCLLDIK